MGLNFPNAPTVGQQWPSPPVAGVPVYQWDGEKWTAGPPAIPDGLVHYDISQSLTSPQLLQARQNIYAAPFDTMAYNGMQINGGCEINQEGFTGTVALPTNTWKYIIDTWREFTTVAGIGGYWNTVTFPPGYSAGAQIYVSAVPTVGASDVCVLNHPIEGNRIKRLAWGTANAQPITLGYWAFAFRPGAYGSVVKNGGASRSYVFSTVINASMTWEWKTITIPGDQAGTWPTDNSIAMQLQFALYAGGSQQTAPNVWTAGNFHAPAGALNAVQSTSDLLLITGLVVLPGLEAPSAARAPFIIRPFDQELITCRRYFQNYNTDGDVATQFAVGICYGTSLGVLTMPFQTPMRTGPALVAVTASDFYLASTAGNVTPSSITKQSASTTLGAILANMPSATLTIGHGAYLRAANVNAKISWDARL